MIGVLQNLIRRLLRQLALDRERDCAAQG